MKAQEETVTGAGAYARARGRGWRSQARRRVNIIYIVHCEYSAGCKRHPVSAILTCNSDRRQNPSAKP